MAARGDAAAALCGSLREVTIVTSDAIRTAQFFTQAMCMRLASDTEPAHAQAQRALWGLSPTAQWRELIFDHPAVGQGYRLRVIVMGGGALIRPQMESRLAGGLSVGSAVSSLEQTHDRVTALGAGTTSGIVPLVMTRLDGSTYTCGEIHFRGPEDIHALAVGRPPDLAPVGPIDPVTGIGGPAYSAIPTRQLADLERRLRSNRSGASPFTGLIIEVEEQP
jgi:catechol 2,3-dioxygenase-like lactoylglutathione lyase family enzyme